MTKPELLERLKKEYPIGECLRITEAQMMELIRAGAIKQIDDIPADLYDQHFTAEVMANMRMATAEEIKEATRKIKK